MFKNKEIKIKKIEKLKINVIYQKNSLKTELKEHKFVILKTK